MTKVPGGVGPLIDVRVPRPSDDLVQTKLVRPAIFFIRLIPLANIAIVATVLFLRTYIHYGKLVMELPSSDLTGATAEANSAALTVLVQRSAYMLAIEDTWRFLQLTCVVGLLLCLTLRRGPLLPAAAKPARPLTNPTG